MDPEAPPQQLAVPRVVAATWSSLEPSTRRKIVLSGLVAAMLAGLDAVGVGLLPSLIDRFQASGEGSAGWSTTTVAAVAGACLITKSVGGLVVVYWQASFLAHDEGERTIALFRRILSLPYAEAVGRETAGFIRDLHVAMPQLYRGAGVGLALLIADGLGIIGLVIVVMINSPVAGLALAIFLVIAAWLHSKMIRSRVERLSVLFHEENKNCLNELGESFGALKTLKAFGAEGVATHRFAKTRRRFALTSRDVLVFQQFARYYLEVALVFGLAVCLGLVWLVDGRGAVLASFGLLTGVAARAMPALARCLYSLTLIKVSGAAVLGLREDLNALEDLAAHEAPRLQDGPSPATRTACEFPAGNEATNGAPLVELAGVSFRYPTAHDDALHDVHLQLGPGELVVIQGESGAGKTTLVDLLIGLLEPKSGTVRQGRVGTVGYVAQDTFVWNDTIRFNVAVERPTSDSDVDGAVWASLGSARLADWVRSLPDGLETVLGERGGRMSGGQRQRLGLARAMYGHPSILILDEPTSALDGETSRSLMSAVAAIKERVGVIVVTHDPIVLDFADRVIVLEPRTGGRETV